MTRQLVTGSDTVIEISRDKDESGTRVQAFRKYEKTEEEVDKKKDRQYNSFNVMNYSKDLGLSIVEPEWKKVICVSIKI